MFFPPEAGFFHDEIECPVGATVLAIRLCGSLLTSRMIADSVKNSIEFLSQKWGFLGFCFNGSMGVWPCEVLLLKQKSVKMFGRLAEM